MTNLITDLKAIPRNSRVLLGVTASWFFTAGLVASWQNLYLNLLGGYLLVGTVASISIGLGLLFSYIGGHLGTAYSEKPILLVSITITALGYFIFALASTLELVLVGVILITFSSLGSACSTSLYFGEVEPAKRGLASGVKTVATNATTFAAPVVGTHLLLNLLGFGGLMRTGLLLTAICLAINGALVAWLVQTPRIASGFSRSSPHRKTAMLQGTFAVFRLPPALQLLLVVAILEGVASSISSTYEIFIVTEIVGVPIELYSVALLVYGLCYIPLGFVFGRYADSKGRWPCALGFLVLPAINLGLILCRGFWQLLLLLLVGAGGFAAWMQAEYPLITDLTPRPVLSSVFAIFLALPGLFAFGAPLLSSLFLVVFPLQLLWALEVAIYTLAALFLLLAYRWKPQSVTRSPVEDQKKS